MSHQYVSVELGGETRQLRFDFNVVSELEERLGRGIIAVLTKEQIGFNTTRVLYWAGLKWKDRGLTVERVGLMLQKEIEDGKSLPDLMEPVINAFVKSGLLGKVEDGDEGDEEPDPNETTA